MIAITPHLRHPRDPRQSVCGIPVDKVRRWETEDPPRAHTCEDCLTQYEEAARPDDANHPIGDATLIDTLRRIVAERQYAKIDGVLVDVWSASVTVLIWDNLREDKRQRLLKLPSHELILRCIRIYTSLATKRGER
ncbi:hypothetical protein [Actinoplanes derwentensis]|uniref:Uncharacterized protein n=1 Tax=Actinoplanes derwentensis TaxID=113562 RepID=A0A1H1XVG4_9ACTN|nr:hypothetical protein [Actinoplanes derwentensis]GID90123.1 hypothetical protein Ade03nite_90470 [Actinoplanes derwentensis]SDT13217.1 hypothetical protein SAMN04489716_2605 [Actinoplanes derwentensis]